MKTAICVSSSSVLQPILRIGLFGFSAEQRDDLCARLKQPGGLPRWQVCDFADADAWWINGDKVRVLADGSLRVLAGLPSERALKLNMSEIDRPIAFTRPLPSMPCEPLCTFDPASQPGILGVLLKFNTLLNAVRVQYALGATISSHGSDLRRRIYHVCSHGRLLAVLNFCNGNAGISPQLHVADLQKAQWESRPPGAGDIPGDFLNLKVRQLSWTYASRCGLNMLPPIYRTATLYYRQVPRVPLSWTRDSQLLLLREILFEPATMEALRQRTGFAAEQLKHDLTCLYYAGAITATRGKSHGQLTHGGDSDRHSAGSTVPSAWQAGEVVPLHEEIMTPTLLQLNSRPRSLSGVDYFDKVLPGRETAKSYISKCSPALSPPRMT
jgi:hypothetical protein